MIWGMFGGCGGVEGRDVLNYLGCLYDCVYAGASFWEFRCDGSGFEMRVYWYLSWCCS